MSPENKNLKKKKKKKNLKEKKNLPVEIKGESNFDFDSTQQETLAKKKKKTEFNSKKKKTEFNSKKKGSEVDLNNADGVDREDHKGLAKEKKTKLGLKRKRRREVENDADASNEDQIHWYEHAAGDRPKSDHAKSSTQFETLEGGNSEKPTKASNGTKAKTKKAKKEMKRKKKDFIAEEREIEQTLDVVDDRNIEEILSVDDDCSRGMKTDGVEHEDLDGDRKGSAKENKSKLGLKKKRRRKIENDVDASNEDQIHGYEHAAGNRPKSDHAKSSTKFETLKEDGNSEKPTKASNGTKIKTKKAKKEMKRKKKDFIAEERKIEQTLDLLDDGNIEEISSVDDDCSRGMKKWLIKYKESRPGLNILQERIDDFIAAYEDQQEQERKEREARAAEGGWTVVVHHKGRKKTTEAESGVTVGSVAQAAVVDKMGKKKSKEVPLDFYRFKKREAQRNEIMMQHNKFEQDKKRIQQLRSARKFRPY